MRFSPSTDLAAPRPPQSPAHAQDQYVAAAAPFSVLRLSAAARLFAASGVVALLWAGVFWALR